MNKKTTYTIDLDDEQTHTALTLAAAKSVLVKHAAQAALDGEEREIGFIFEFAPPSSRSLLLVPPAAGDIPLLQAAIKRLEAPARPRKPSDTVASAAAPIEVDRSMLTPAWLCGYVDSVGTSEIRRGRAAVKVSFPSTPSGQELQKAFAHAFQTPDHEGDMCTSQQHTVVFSGDLHPAHALNVLGGSLSIMRKAFEEAATPPAPKPRAPRLPKKRPVADENTDPNVGASSGPKKQKVGDAVGAPLGSDTPPPPPPASQTQLEADAGTSSS